jgi:FLYWCH zinc finger domain
MAGSVESTRGRMKFIDGGYQFVFDKRSRDGQTLFRRCDQKHNGCHARLHTANDTVSMRMHDHNHGTDAAAVNVTAPNHKNYNSMM